MHKPLRRLCHFFRADPAYGIGVANALGIDIDQSIPNGAAQPEAFGRKNANGKTREQTDLTTSLNPSHLSTEHHGFRIVRVPVGPSAGTQERLVLVQEGELRGFDLGNQGGGQN
jgi:hypothetical protein